MPTFLRSLAWFWIKRLIRQKFPAVNAISTAELADWLEDPDRENPLLLDTRTTEEYAVSHLPGARRVMDPDQYSGGDLERAIVTYCSVGYRSARLAQQLQEKGYSRVWNLEGSIFQWANEGRFVYRDHQPVHQVHPYNPQWGLLLLPELRSPQSN